MSTARTSQQQLNRSAEALAEIFRLDTFSENVLASAADEIRHRVAFEGRQNGRLQNRGLGVWDLFDNEGDLLAHGFIPELMSRSGGGFVGSGPLPVL